MSKKKLKEKPFLSEILNDFDNGTIDMGGIKSLLKQMKASKKDFDKDDIWHAFKKLLTITARMEQTLKPMMSVESKELNDEELLSRVIGGITCARCYDVDRKIEAAGHYVIGRNNIVKGDELLTRLFKLFKDEFGDYGIKYSITVNYPLYGHDKLNGRICPMDKFFKMIDNMDEEVDNYNHPVNHLLTICSSAERFVNRLIMGCIEKGIISPMYMEHPDVIEAKASLSNAIAIGFVATFLNLILYYDIQHNSDEITDNKTVKELAKITDAITKDIHRVSKGYVIFPFTPSRVYYTISIGLTKKLDDGDNGEGRYYSTYTIGGTNDIRGVTYFGEDGSDSDLKNNIFDDELEKHLCSYKPIKDIDPDNNDGTILFPSPSSGIPPFIDFLKASISHLFLKTL